jgi:hypothetical protein
LDEYTKNKEEELKKLREEFNKKPRVIYQTEYYESSESKRIREQNALEEKNRVAASKELPNIIDKIKTDYFAILNEKISKIKEIIEEKINNYSPDNLKIFFQNLAKKEKILDKLYENLKQKSEIFLNSYYKKSNHLMY